MALAASTADQIRKLVERFPERRSALLPALKLAQADRGYLPPQTVAETADLVGVPHSAAFELVTFYTMLHTEPQASHKVVVCAQLPCALRGAEALLRELRGQLAGEIADGHVDVERTSECFGACHRAPMARLNDEYREGLVGANVQALVEELRRA
ncbi:MAG: NAD(P)H-dependent oxidoreductase subunit E [Chloroflexota bacterium]|nr:NAD(P)H-dependent oxidoreductase subunit E [Chloroflexota bacterium]